jgi:hypothetical protein
VLLCTQRPGSVNPYGLPPHPETSSAPVKTEDRETRLSGRLSRVCPVTALITHHIIRKKPRHQ